MRLKPRICSCGLKFAPQNATQRTCRNCNADRARNTRLALARLPKRILVTCKEFYSAYNRRDA